MKYFVLYTVFAVGCVEAQKSGAGGKNPYASKAGQVLKDPPDPLKLMPSKNIPWPEAFGLVKVPHGIEPKGCAPLEVIVARGTSEPGDLGVIVGDPVVARCKRDLGKDVCRGYPVQYDATLASFLDGKGPKNIADRVARMKTECPNMKFVVVGYSQGGVIAAGGLTQVAKAGNADRVIGVVFYAPFANAGVPSQWSKKSVVWCAKGDSVCGGGTGTAAHTSYNSEGTKFHEDTAKKIVAWYNASKGSGAKLRRSVLETMI